MPRSRAAPITSAEKHMQARTLYTAKWIGCPGRRAGARSRSTTAASTYASAGGAASRRSRDGCSAGGAERMLGCLLRVRMVRQCTAPVSQSRNAALCCTRADCHFYLYGGFRSQPRKRT